MATLSGCANVIGIEDVPPFASGSRPVFEEDPGQIDPDIGNADPIDSGPTTCGYFIREGGRRPRIATRRPTACPGKRAARTTSSTRAARVRAAPRSPAFRRPRASRRRTRAGQTPTRAKRELLAPAAATAVGSRSATTRSTVRTTVRARASSSRFRTARRRRSWRACRADQARFSRSTAALIVGHSVIRARYSFNVPSSFVRVTKLYARSAQKA